MSELKQHGAGADPAESNGKDGDNPRGPNLALLYSLIALALVAAIAIACMIVLPFYHRR
jgi:hypothetical protein